MLTLSDRTSERVARQLETDGAGESGFTLIELMVVLLILAVLLAIAIPTFLGTTGSANDRSAQSNLNTAQTNAKSIFQHNGQAYPLWVSPQPSEPLAVTIASYEPSLPMTNVTTAAGVTSVQAGKVAAATDVANPNGAIIMSLAMNTQECWWIAENTASMGAIPGPSAASAPWTATAPGVTAAPNYTEPTGHAGVPQAAGVWYGVYKLGSGQATCDTSVLASVLSNVNTASFPPAQ